MLDELVSTKSSSIQINTLNDMVFNYDPQILGYLSKCGRKLVIFFFPLR